MAAKITGASLQPILRRMNDAPNYHPFEADAFSDWSMNAGDLITINRGEESYTSPVNVSRMVWKGNTPTVRISSTGNKNREPIAKVSRKKYGRGSAGVRSQERFYLEFTSEDGILHSELHMTEASLRTEFVDYGNSLRGEFEITASHLRTEFEDGVNSLRGSLEMTASRLRTEFNDDVNSLRSDFEITASHLRTEFNDDVNSLRGDFEMTASRLRTEFEDDVNSLRSDFEITASHLRTEFNDDVNSLRGDFEMTASRLRTEFEDDVNSLRGDFEMTASRLRTEFEDGVNSLRGDFEMTASRLRTEFEDGVNSLRGDFEMTASHLRTEFGDDVNSLRGDFEMTASHLQTIFENDVNSLRGDFEVTAAGLRGEFESGLSSMRGEFEVTASGLRGEFESGLGSMRGEFQVTASGLRGEFQTGLSSMRGEFEVTASGLRSEFETATGSLRNEFEVTSSSFGTRISKVVDESGNIKTAQICVAINEDNSSQAVIEADKIHLLGQTITDTITAQYISNKIAAIATINANNILAGSISVVVGQTTSPVATETYVRGCPWDLRITQSGNTYTLQQKRLGYEAVWEDVGSFSRATTLSAGWDGNRKFTVGASPQNVRRDTTIISAIPNANVTWDGTMATIALKAIIDEGETTVDVGNVTMDIANFLQNKTGDAKITSNGLYFAESGYVGFGNIEIDVPQSTVEPTSIGIQWDGSRNLVATANPQGISRYTTIMSAVPNANVTWNGTTATLALKATYDGGETSVDVGNVTTDVSSKLQSKTVTSNGTVTPSSGYIGLSSVTVNVPASNARAHFGAASGQYFIEAVDTVSGNQIPGSTVNYSLTVSGRNVTISAGSGQTVPSIALGIDTGTLSNGSRTLTVTAGGESTTATATITDYTTGLYAGKAAVTISDTLTWTTTPASGISVNQNTVTVKTSGRTNSSGATSESEKTINLYSQVGSWGTPAENKCYVYVTHTDSAEGHRILRREVNASTLVTNAGYAGRAAVTISSTLTWTTTPASGISVNQNAVTVKTSGRTNSSGATSESEKTINLYSQVGSWGTPAENKCYVYVTHTDSAEGHRILRREVNASTLVTNAGYAGRAAVTISSTLTWTTTPASGISVNQNAVTVKTSGRTNSSGTASESEKTINLYSQVGSWGTPAANKCYVYVTHTDSAEGHRILRREVNASTLVTNAGYAGRAAVTISSTLTWTTTPASGISVNQNAVTVKTSGRTNSSGATSESEKTINLYSNVGSWGTPAANKCYVYVTHTNSTEGNRILRREVDATSIYNNGKANADHTVSGFGTRSDSGYTYTIEGTSYTNNSSGYVIMSGSGTSTVAAMIVRGAWFCDGVSREKYNYLKAAPTNLYRNAYKDGWKAFYQAHHWPSSNDSSATITVSIPSSTAGSSWDSEQRNYVLQNKDDNTVYLRYSNVTYAQFTHNKLYLGKSRVTISDTLTWTTTPASGISVNQNAVTVKTSGRTTSSGTASESEKKINFYSQVGSWGTPATNKCYVYVTHTDSAEGHRILRREVDASRIYTNGKDDVWNGVSIENTGGTGYETVSGSGATKVVKIPFTTVVSSAGMTNKIKDDYWRQAPTQIWQDAYAEGVSAASSNVPHTIKDFKTGSPKGAGVTISGVEYKNTDRMYVKRSNSNENSTVIIVTSGEWKCDGKTRTQDKYNYLQTGPTNIWHDAYIEGFDANHSLFLGDANYKAKSSEIIIQPGHPQEVWAYFKKSDDTTYQWSSKYTLKAASTSHSISQSHAYSSNLATLANDLGASGSSELTDLGTFPAAGGRNYWGIRVSCGGAVKYYYVHTT